MNISIQSDDGNVIRAQVSGKITQSDVSPFVEPLSDAAGQDVYRRRVVLNMEEVEMLDSSGVGWLLVCHKRFRETGGVLVLHSYPPIVGNVLKVLNLHQVLTLADDEDAAVQKAAEEQS